MDGDRFDAFSKSVATPATRRTALGGMVASGLLAALGIRPAMVAAQDVQEAQDAQDAKKATCVIDFAATVRQGPNAGQTAGEVRGELIFGLSGKGNLEDATLRLEDGSSLPVVGQATGHSLQMRIQLAADQALVAIGVGEQEIAACEGAVDGLVTGPAAGDLGDWHAVVVRSTGAADAAGGQKKDKKDAAQEAAGAGTQKAAKEKKGGRKTDAQQGAGSGGTGGAQQPPADSDAGDGGATDAPESEPVPEQCANRQTDCGGVCVDLRDDPANCGACGTACGDAMCVSGVCMVTPPEVETCTEGLTDCGGVCVDLLASRSACGSCDTICAETDDCVGGACQPVATGCAEDETDCGGTCVNTATDSANCGSCGVACPAGNECQGGACIASVAPPADNCAPQGLTACAGFCIDTANDAANCGACGVVCAPGESCAGGACQAAGAPGGPCPDGETDCGGVCTNLNDDFGNCGACGVACGESQGCSAGQCVDQTAPPVDCTTQGPGLTECAGLCFDLQTDASNCGSCGVVCPSQCVGGVCA